MPILDRLLELHSQLVARSRDLDVAEEIASRYANMKDSLMTSAEDLPIAEQNLNRWIGLQDRIVLGKAGRRASQIENGGAAAGGGTHQRQAQNGRPYVTKRCGNPIT